MRTIEERILNVKGIDYIIREDGKIFSTHNRGRAKYHQEIKQRINSDGYMCITVGKTGNRTVASVHRLVAKAFIPNPLNLPEVNHKDYNRTNNSVDNLEWCSHKENIDYTLAAGRHASQTLDYSGKKIPTTETPRSVRSTKLILHIQKKNNLVPEDRMEELFQYVC